MINPISKKIRQMTNKELEEVSHKELGGDMYGEFKNQVKLEIQRRKDKNGKV